MSPLLVLPVPVESAVVAVPVQNPAPPPGQGPEFGKASPVALVVIIVLALVTVLLIRSMSKHLRRVPASFEGGDEKGGKSEKEPPASAPPSGKDA